MNIIKQKGTSTVEFAMLVPLLLLLIFMVSEFSVMFYRLNAVTKSVQVAARYLSDVCVYHSDTAKYCTTIEEDNARNLAVYGFTTANIVITNPNLQHVQVTATYNSSFILDNTLNAIMQLATNGHICDTPPCLGLTLHASSVMRFTQ